MNHDELLQRAQLLFQQHRKDQAAEQLKRLLANDPSIAEAHSWLALCYLENRDRWHDATREAEAAVHLAPDQSFSHYVLAAVLDRRSRSTEAIESIQEAIRLDPSQSPYYALLASLLIQQAQWQNALEAANWGLQVDPENTSCANMRSLALERLGKTEDSLEQADSAVARNPDSADAHGMRGWALLQNGRYRDAQEAFRESLRLDPTNEFARQGMIQALNSNNVLFRIVFKFYSLMGRLAGGVQWAIIIGLFLGMKALRAFADANPEWAPYVAPISFLYLGFCLLSWIADPLFNAFLRFHPFGKYLLSTKQRWASNLVAGLLLLAGLLCGIEIVQGHYPEAILLGLVLVFLTIPTTIPFNVDRGWPQLVACAIAIGMALLAVLSIALILIDGPWILPVSAFGIGIFIVTLVGNYLTQATVKH